jgi:hypothetical protein
MKAKDRLWLAMVPVCVMTAAAAAQHGPPTPTAAEDPPGGGSASRPEEAKAATEDGGPKVSASLEVFVNHVLSSDFDGQPGDVGVTRAGADLSVSVPLGERRSLGFGLGAMHSWYEFDGATGFVSSGEPWENITELDLSAVYRGPINESFGYLVGANVNASLESGADFSDSLTFGGRVGFTYAVSDTATIGLGVGVSSRLEDDAVVIPFPVLSWQFAEGWRLHSYGSSRGSGLAVSYSPCETWTLTLRGGFEAHEFRLDETGSTPDGVGRSWHLPVEFLAAWKAHEQVTVKASVGVMAWQRYTLDDSAGNEIAEMDADPSVVFGVGVELVF